MPHITLIPTPIGNLEDLTFRALRLLKEADLIAAEDTRTSGKLLKHYEIKVNFMAFHAHNEHRMLPKVIELLESEQRVVLLTDAGTPGISDPGFLLVRACVEAGIAVETLPGATAFVPALVNSGLPVDRFCFEGFLPHKKGRQKRLKELAGEQRTLVFYESPHRMVKTLGQFAEFFGPERRASVSREISKLHEETVRGTVTELAALFESKGTKGEFVIVVAGAE